MKYVLKGEMLLDDMYTKSILSKLKMTYKQVDGTSYVIDELNDYNFTSEEKTVLSKIIRDLANDTTKDSFVTKCCMNKRLMRFTLTAKKEEVRLFLLLLTYIEHDTFVASFLDNDIEKHSKSLDDMIHFVTNVKPDNIIYGNILINNLKCNKPFYDLLEENSDILLVRNILDSEERFNFVVMVGDKTNIIIKSENSNNPYEDVVSLLDVLEIGVIEVATLTIGTPGKVDTFSGDDKRIREQFSTKVKKKLVDRLIETVESAYIHEPLSYIQRKNLKNEFKELLKEENNND